MAGGQFLVDLAEPSGPDLFLIASVLVSLSLAARASAVAMVVLGRRRGRLAALDAAETAPEDETPVSGLVDRPDPVSRPGGRHRPRAVRVRARGPDR